jgi:molybdenum cofactor cytidylyltransferase
LISIIVLAAGLSSRFGRNKLLEPVQEKTMIERVVGECAESKVDDVIVVLGHEADKIRIALRNTKCRFVVNDRYSEGQSSSVKVGMKEALKSDAVLILTGDSAFVTADDINRVIQKYRASHGIIVAASHEGKLGHPVLFDKMLFDEILKIDEATQGLKAVLKRHSDSLAKVECRNVGVTLDVDREEDLRTYGRLFEA